MPGPAPATPPGIPGAEAPALRQALTDWLADDEAVALPALSELAQDGNTAARLLLGLIDKTPALQGPFLAHIARRDRIALLRAPGGFSGRNWLGSLGDLPLARAWSDLWTVEAGPVVIETFTALDEPRAAREAMVVLAAREHPALRTMPADGIDTDLLYLFWRSADAERRAQLAGLVPVGHPQRLMMGETIDARDTDLWLASAEAAAPIETLCAATCPGDDAPACRSAAYRALNSHNALLTLGTPAETLVPQAEFLGSARGRATVMRRILLATPMSGRRAMLARVRTHSECLGTALSAENGRYMPPLPNLAPRD
ncbi:MAG: hypothetical protein H6898_11640 [Rhodobacter sp.]|nr:hypothetical protein [Paracoccaceae bacterium]MCC0077220.1 hypothetical protein [Rhodobacter sp.]